MDTTKLTEKAREAVQRRNYAYALDLYQQALALNPDSAEARRELRAVAGRYVQEKGISPSAAWIKGAGSVFKILLYGMSAANAEKLMIECERFLANDPSNMWAATKLGLAAMQLKYYQAATAVFEDLRQSYPENIPTLYHLAEAYESIGQVNQAINVCNTILKLDNHQHDAQQKMRDLSAIQTTQVFAKGAEEGSRSIVKDESAHEEHEILIHEVRSVEQRNKAVAFTQEKLARAGGKTDPRHLATFHASIGDLWLMVEPEFERAEAAYQQARELQPTDYTYKFKLDDLEIKRFEVRLKASPGDAKLKAEHDDFRVKSFEVRVKVRPMDLNVAFVLGNAYFAMGRLDEAIGQFQRTVNDPVKRVDSLTLLGVCFSRKRQYELAAKQFTQAVGEMETMNERKKVALYNLGDTYAKMSKAEDAIKTFTQLYEADITFKDVAKRLEDLRKAAGPKAG